MKRQEIIENIKVRSGKDMLDLLDRSEKRVYVTIKKEILPKLVRYLFNDIKAIEMKKESYVILNHMIVEF